MSQDDIFEDSLDRIVRLGRERIYAVIDAMVARERGRAAERLEFARRSCGQRTRFDYFFRSINQEAT